MAEFLLLDRLFPRSVVHALSHRGGVPGGAEPGRRPGPGVDDPARRPVGRLRNRLEYADPKQLTAQLPELLSTLQETCVRGERGDRQAVLPVPDAGRLGTGRLSVGWRLRIEHTTNVTYAGPVLTSFNEARMTPLTLPTQMTLESRVTAGPGVPVWTYNDYWGTFVSVFDLPEPHDDLVIRGDRHGRDGAVRRLPGPASRLLGGAARAGRRRPAARVPAAHAAHHGDRRDLEAALAEISGLSPDAAAEAISGPGPRARHLHAGRDRRAHQRPGGLGQGPGRLPGHGAAHGRPDARRRPARPVRLRLPAPRPEGRAWQHLRRPVPRLVEYWAGAWTPLDPTSLPRSASATSSSPAAATTATSPRSRASTTARRGDMRVTVEVTRLA